MIVLAGSDGFWKYAAGMPDGAPPKPPIALSSGDDDVWIERCCVEEGVFAEVAVAVVVGTRAAIVVMLRGNVVEMEVEDEVKEV